MIVRVSTLHCAPAISQAITKIFHGDKKIDLEHAIAEVLMQHNLDDEQVATASEPSDELPVVFGRQPVIHESCNSERGKECWIGDSDSRACQRRMNKSAQWENRFAEFTDENFWPSRAAAVDFLLKCAAQASEPQQIWADRKRGIPEHQDRNVEAVVEKHRSRAAVVLKKYGVTTERGDLTVAQWLQHAQDEAMDLAIYLQRLIGEQEIQEWDEALANPACVSDDGPEDSFDLLCG
jgi:hypothetical protein